MWHLYLENSKNLNIILDEINVFADNGEIPSTQLLGSSVGFVYPGSDY